MNRALQWGGRFSQAPDGALLRFSSSLDEDLVLAPFDVRCSLGHVEALESGKVISTQHASELRAALKQVESEIASGAFCAFARESGAEDVHGSIDARVRELAPGAGELLHAGRSRNDQVATSLLLYGADRARRGKALAISAVKQLWEQAQRELDAQTLLAGTTHWQPAQPILLAFWLCAAARPFVRDARRFAGVAEAALAESPLGSAALAGSSLPLDRSASAANLGFTESSANAMDAIGNRDVVLDLAHACTRALVNASRVCEEFVMWCTPNFGYVQLDDAACTGSSLMPQKRNPDPFELVRAHAARATGDFAGALASISGIGLSYHRDLQVTKAAAIGIVERAMAALEAFVQALPHVRFNRERMTQLAGMHYTVATDMADALIANGATARAAHARIGEEIVASERDGVVPEWPDAHASVRAKATRGSTNPREVAATLAKMVETVRELDA